MKSLLLVFLLNSNCFAHGGIDHSKPAKIESSKKSEVVPGEVLILDSIKSDYNARIEPLFKKSCFNCHSARPDVLPWYYSIPGVNILMNAHMKEAKEHLDMTSGYPFISHVGRVEDLTAIKDSVDKNQMPPWYYKIFHSESRLNESEKNEIRKWVSDSINKLKK